MAIRKPAPFLCQAIDIGRLYFSSAIATEITIDEVIIVDILHARSDLPRHIAALAALKGQAD